MFTTNSDIQEVSTIVEDYTAVDKVGLGHDETSNQIPADAVQSRLSGYASTPGQFLCYPILPANLLKTLNQVMNEWRQKYLSLNQF